MALEKIDNVAAAYVNRGITIPLAEAGDLDQEAIAAAIKPFNIKITSGQAVEGKPF